MYGSLAFSGSCNDVHSPQNQASVISNFIKSRVIFQITNHLIFFLFDKIPIKCISKWQSQSLRLKVGRQLHNHPKMLEHRTISQRHMN